MDRYSWIFICIGGVGLMLFLKNGLPDYLFFRVPFAFLDYEKAGWLVFLENLAMLSFWVFIGSQMALICRKAAGKAEAKKNPLLPVVAIMTSVIIGMALFLLFPSADGQTSFGNTDWSTPQAESKQHVTPTKTQEASQPDGASPVQKTSQSEGSSLVSDIVSVNDGFILIGGGSFLMGSPERENWRIDDEAQHTVLSVHYSGGSALANDVAAWLEANGIKK